jgi:tRNA(fMet)-specific endonuclease VapC
MEPFNGKIDIRDKLNKIKNNGLTITPLILCELYKGAAHSGVKEKRLNFIEELLDRIDVLNFNETACRIFGSDHLKLKKKRNLIKDNDLMISSICKAHGHTLVTMDKKHFDKISQLKVEIW